MSLANLNHLGDNLTRLIGMHALTTRRASAVLGLSAQLLSEIQSGKRRSPRIATVQHLSRFFDLSMERLMDAPFEDLLANELANPERYRAVEERISGTEKRSAR